MPAARPWWAARVMSILESGKLVAIERNAVFVHGLLLTLMAQSSGDRGNSDLAVAIVELGLLALGVFLALLRCLSRLHFHVTFSDPSLGFLDAVLVNDWGRIAQQFVSYRGV
jgi:hypothetical protein